MNNFIFWEYIASIVKNGSEDNIVALFYTKIFKNV